ncbi:MAG: hypothetical protein A2073_00880 [Deltaproteobacteria bacterium GWC2_42_11]|nr:MAG: hypothetical protein A2073_00880 [Deltaproteobacteria bacterium GWC2_42_11]
MKAGFKRYFFTGILVVVPLYITGYVVSIIINFMDDVMGFLPKILHPDTYLPFHIPGVGIIVTLLIILVTGALTANLAGKKLVEFGEGILDRIPFLRSIYSSTKQFIDTLFINKHESFRKVILVEFPKKDIYTIGFLIGPVTKEIESRIEEKLVSIFIPTSPIPTTGYYLVIPEKNIIPLDMSIEMAFKLIITAGVLTSENNKGGVVI